MTIPDVLDNSLIDEYIKTKDEESSLWLDD